MAYELQIRSLLRERSDLKVVVIKEKWDPPTVPLLILRQQVSSSFPHSRKIGFFTVYWRP
jgi:hypothetical protein